MNTLPSYITPRDDVLFQDLDGESVLLNLDNEHYHGLGEVGTRIWELLTADSSVETLIETIVVEYDVDEATFRNDLATLIDQLLAENLIQVSA